MIKKYILALAFLAVASTAFLSVKAVTPIEGEYNFAANDRWDTEFIEGDSNYVTIQYTLEIQESAFDPQAIKVFIGFNYDYGLTFPNSLIYQQVDFFRVFHDSDGTSNFISTSQLSSSLGYYEAPSPEYPDSLVIQFGVTFLDATGSSPTDQAAQFLNGLKAGDFMYIYEATSETLEDLWYQQGYDDGKEDGYQEGLQADSDYGQNWIVSFFQLFQVIFYIQLLPGLNIGTLVGIPISIKLTLWIIGVIRGRS
jgi:hypothetical protein